MLIDVNLKSEIVKTNKNSMKTISKIHLKPLTPKIHNLLKSTSE